MTEIFEMLMVVSFGVSWPVSIRKSYISRTAKGKSPMFMYLILFGYACGIFKCISGKVTYVFFFYILNFVLVSVDILLYYRNRRIDSVSIQKSGTA